LNRMRSHQRELRIGGIFPVTGYLSWSGVYKKKAAELKVEMINRCGGINGLPLRLIAYDDRSCAAHASLIAEKLIFKHRVVAMAGTGSLPISKAVAAVANRYRTPLFVNSGYAIDPLKDSFVFNTAHKTEFAVACAFQYFIEHGMNRLALLMPFGPLGDLGSSIARNLSRTMGIRIVGEERFELSSTDVTSQLKRLRDLRPLAFFSFVTGQPTVIVSSAMARLELRLPLLVSHGNANPRLLKMICRAPIRLILPTGKTMAMDRMEETALFKNGAREFSLLHMERFGEPVNYSSAESADAIDLIAEGLRRTGEADGEELRDAVESIRNFNGMQGIYNLSPVDHYGTAMEQMVLLTAGDGAWRLEMAFPRSDHFEDVHVGRKANLVRVLADLLTSPSMGGPWNGRKSPFGFIASGSENHSQDPGRGTHLLSRLSCQRKRELSRSIREGDFRRAGELVFKMLSVVLVQDFERRDKIKLAVLELFLLLFHSAIEEGNIEDLAGLDQRFTAEWETLEDPESLCLWVVRVFDRLRGIAHSDRGSRSDLLKRVLDFIEVHFSEDLPVKRIAQEVCLSPSRLIHRMRREYNTTLGSCIVRVRMEKAKALLRDTDISIGAIAQDVGYRDQSHFTRIFRKHVGFTPKAYRDASLIAASG